VAAAIAAAMKLGLFSMNFGACADPTVQVRIAQLAEELGYESLWTGEHVAMPLRDNPVPIAPETPFLDSIVALTNIAAHTKRVRLGTGILVLPHHNPVLLAKALTSLDLVSNGRLIAGFAGGYVEPEFRALGVSFPDRGAITDESLEAIRALWTQEEPRFAGRFASFSDIRFEPKPRQRPHPPIIIGGASPPALRRAARYEGWYGFAQTVEQASGVARELRRLRAEAGRGSEPFEISLTTFETLTPELMARASAGGIDRIIYMPMGPPEHLEASVRDIGTRFAA
jgi:probable F420-dependent oxidoreductase